MQRMECNLNRKQARADGRWQVANRWNPRRSTGWARPMAGVRHHCNLPSLHRPGPFGRSRRPKYAKQTQFPGAECAKQSQSGKVARAKQSQFAGAGLPAPLPATTGRGGPVVQNKANLPAAHALSRAPSIARQLPVESIELGPPKGPVLQPAAEFRRKGWWIWPYRRCHSFCR